MYARNVVAQSLGSSPKAWFWYGSYTTLIRFLDTFAWRTIWVSTRGILRPNSSNLTHCPPGLYALEYVRFGEVEGGSRSSDEEGWISKNKLRLQNVQCISTLTQSKLRFLNACRELHVLDNLAVDSKNSVVHKHKEQQVVQVDSEFVKLSKERSCAVVSWSPDYVILSLGPLPRFLRHTIYYIYVLRAFIGAIS